MKRSAIRDPGLDETVSDFPALHRLRHQPAGRTSEKAEAILLKRFRLMLAVQSCLQKYFCSRLTQIKSISPPSRPTEGRIAIVTDAGRDAMDAAASGALMARGRMALFRLRQSFGGLAQGPSKPLA